MSAGQMLDFVPSIRKLPNTRYCCRNLEFFPNHNISNIRQLFSAENTAENVFVVTLLKSLARLFGVNNWLNPEWF